MWKNVDNPQTFFVCFLALKLRLVQSVTEVLQDLRYSFRNLVKSPIFFLTAALTLGLGIGVNTTVFSSLNGWLFRPLPVKDPKNLVVLALRDNLSQFAQGPSYPDYLDYKSNTRLFQDAAAIRLTVVNFHRNTESDRLWLEAVSPNYFSMLGMSAAAEGRLFGPSDERNPVLVLSYATWAGRFGSDRSVIGSSVRLNAHSFTVIGVTPKNYHGAISYVESDGFVPVKAEALSLNTDDRQERGFRMLARLASGMTLQRAQSAVAVVGADLAREYPAADQAVRPILVSEIDSRPEPSVNVLVRRMMASGMALVFIVLLIASANTANLLLVQGAKRRREFAIRSAMGATRGRLVRLIFTESLLIGFAGLVVGVFLSAWMRAYLSAYQPAVDFRFRQNNSFDGNVLAFTIAVTLVTSIICGLFPAVRIARSNLNQIIKDSGASRGSAKQLLASALVVAQVACCALMLICTGVFVRGLANAANTKLGYEQKGREVFSFNLGRQGYTSESSRTFIKKLLDDVNEQPGVHGAAFVNWLPFSGFSVMHVYREGEVPDEKRAGRSVMWNIVGPLYFTAAGTRLTAGREFTYSDDANSKAVAIVNQAFAHALWPGEDAVGKRFRVGAGDEWREIVGVVETAKYLQLDEAPQPWYFVPFTQQRVDGGALIVHSAMPPAEAIDQVRKEFRVLDPELPVFGVMTLEHVVQHSYALGPSRVGTEMAVLFSAVGLLLAIIGLYGVIANSVEQRTKEIGIRLSLGANRRTVIRFVLRQGLVLITLGLGIGTLFAFGLSGLFSRFIYGVSPMDPATLGGVAGLVLLIGLAACYVPSRTASRIDPAVALRAE